jgi:hypothetical protein
MPDNDQLNDGTVLSELHDSLTDLDIPQRPRLEAITARGRAHRRQRVAAVAGLSVAGAAAATALVLGLTGVLGPASARGTGTVRTAAFTIVSNPDGTTTLTIKPQVLFDPSTLQADLEQNGIPAMVTSGSFCSSDPAPADISQAVSFQPGFQSDAQQQQVPDPTVTINPAGIPAGTELSFGTFPVPPGRQTTIALIDTTAYTCTGTAPTTLPPGGALLRWGDPSGS